MRNSGLPFPSSAPRGCEPVEDDVTFNPDRHLRLETPDEIWTLKEFGYSDDEIAMCASPVAITSPFRILSEEGVAAVLKVARNLKSVATKLEGQRVPKHLAGGVYRSKFLRDLCECEALLAHMSAICGVDLYPHSLPSQQLYINYTPDDISKAVDAWHYDGIGFDYVLMVSDPKELEGGNFEYFKGTRNEIAEQFNLQVHEVRYGISDALPADRVVKVRFPDAGYAVFQQGDRVVHRAAKLEKPAERITMVPGLVTRNFSIPDPTAKHDIPDYNEPGIHGELARHSAWLAREKLDALISTLDLDGDTETIRSALASSISDISETVKLLDSQSGD